MKKLQNHFTTPEQSKRLLELGVPADSADCYLLRTFTKGDTFIVEVLHDELYSKKDKFTNMLEYLPCWSVGQLIKMWETCVGVKFDRWSRNGVLLPLIEDCIEHIEFALNPYTMVEFDFSKLDD